AGRFAMGSPKSDEWAGYIEMPQRDVTISKAFFLGACEVTQEQYEAIVGNNPSRARVAKNPVESVSWNDAVEFCKKVSAQAGVKMRLPTEAEWEYACRAGSRSRYGFGDKETMLGEYAWFSDNSDVKIHPVGQKKPNAWGLYDRHGNVLEWCSDWRGDYAKTGNRDPKGADSGPYRVVRSGSCYGSTTSCRSASRLGLTPGLRESALGFRVAVDLK
ncbi:MAG: formylglycine-generating enzyme family protein, partial [Planctomycetota bacterium]|nr:formylglycine-generating enzyme family protein [Planctomycetota bacterium]